MLHSVRRYSLQHRRSGIFTWYPQKPRTVIVFGKKRTKRQINPWKPPEQEIRSEWVSEYLEFGVALGFSPEEALERLSKKPNFRDLVKDPKTLASFQELKKREEIRAAREKEMEKVTSGELDWNEIRKGLKNQNTRTPIWDKAKKYVRPERNIQDLLGDSEPESERSEYGRFLLEDENELPEDFSYEDFEAMIEQLPKNMVLDDGDELFTDMLNRPKARRFDSSTEASIGKKENKPIPKLMRPRGSAAPIPQQEEKEDGLEEEVEEKPIPILAAKPDKHKVKDLSKSAAEESEDIPAPELKAPQMSDGFFSRQLEKKEETKDEEKSEKSVKPIMKPRPQRPNRV